MLNYWRSSHYGGAVVAVGAGERWTKVIGPFFLYVNSNVQAKTFQELVAYAKANPGKLAYATGNTTGIVSFAQMNSLAGIDMLHVPYKGEPQGITDLVGGRVQQQTRRPARAMATARLARVVVFPSDALGLVSCTTCTGRSMPRNCTDVRSVR